MTYIPIPNGHVGTIVTSLEMTTRPALQPVPAKDLKLERWEAPALEKYRQLYRRVGEPWLWFSRLGMADAELAAIIHDPKIMIWAVTDPQENEVGILELDFREPHNCEIGFFGLVPELNGKGHGRWLMAKALEMGWAEKNEGGDGVERMWVHTCTLDGPGALAFYIKNGFTPFQRQLETFPDPRLSGHLPMGSASQIPIIA